MVSHKRNPGYYKCTMYDERLIQLLTQGKCHLLWVFNAVMCYWCIMEVNMPSLECILPLGDGSSLPLVIFKDSDGDLDPPCLNLSHCGRCILEDLVQLIQILLVLCRASYISCIIDRAVENIDSQRLLECMAVMRCHHGLGVQQDFQQVSNNA